MREIKLKPDGTWRLTQEEIDWLNDAAAREASLQAKAREQAEEIERLKADWRLARGGQQNLQTALAAERERAERLEKALLFLQKANEPCSAPDWCEHCFIIEALRPAASVSVATVFGGAADRLDDLAAASEPAPNCLCDVGWRHCPIHQDEGRELDTRVPCPFCGQVECDGYSCP